MPPEERDALIVGEAAAAGGMGVRALAVLPEAVGRSGLPPRPDQDAGRRAPHPHHHEGGPAPGPAGQPAVRQQHLRRLGEHPAHPRLVRHDRHPDRDRHQQGRLGAHRRGARTRRVGRGGASERHGVHGRAVQPLHGRVGDARRRGADGREVLPVRRGRAGADAHGRAVVPRREAVRLLRHAVVLPLPCGDRARGGRRPEGVRLPHALLLRRARRLHPRDAQDAGGGVRPRRSSSTAARPARCRRG